MGITDRCTLSLKGTMSRGRAGLGRHQLPLGEPVWCQGWEGAALVTVMMDCLSSVSPTQRGLYGLSHGSMLGGNRRPQQP